MNESFPSSEKLKSKILIEKLFSEGKYLKSYPLKLIYSPIENIEIKTNKTGVSVTKRNFKKAVQRNLIKRLMREAFRKNKYLVDNNLEKNYALMFIYTGNEIPGYSKISTAIVKLLKDLIVKEKKNEE